MYKELDVKGYEIIMKKHNISSLAAKVMIGRNVELVNKIKENNSYDYRGMDSAVSFILKAISEKKKIAIYGDYDVDGICSVSILYRTFNLLNYEVGYYVPNRYKDGYGLSIDIVRQMKNKGYNLIICVDNGIKAFEAIDEAKKLGIKIIVLDHHQKDEKFPDFDLLLHPQYSNFSEYNMCAASICYYLSKALLAREDEKCLALAGIATVGDVMPMISQNKLIVHKAISYLNKYKYKAIDLLNSDNKRYDENLIGMQIVPKLNSIGRMCNDTSINKLVKYLVTENDNELYPVANFIEKTNKNRKEITEYFFKALDKENYSQKIIIEKSDEMIEGVNGIIAARFSNKYKLPAIVFSLDESKKNYKGSARSIGDLDMVELLSKNQFVEFFGGHKAAAGLTIKKDNYQNFFSKIQEDCKNNVYNEQFLEVISIEKEELSFNAYVDLLKLSPFGEENSSPLFVLKNFDSKEMSKSKDGKHILININNEVNLVGFNLIGELKESCSKYDLIFKLELNNLYNNRITCKCVKVEESCNV